MSETVRPENSSNTSIRPVELSDCRPLLNWRNHPDVRRWSYETNEIALEIHEKWFDDWMAQQPRKGYFFVIEHLTVPAGMIRFDTKTNKLFEISILVESNFQGKGIARVAFSLAIDEIKVNVSDFTVLASIHHKNLASINLFKCLDFQESGRSGDFLEFFRNFTFEDS